MTVITKVVKITGNEDLMASTSIPFITLIRLDPTNKFTLIKKNINHDKIIDEINKKDIIRKKLNKLIYSLKSSIISLII